ncbi:hypothetical protein MINTMi27_14900 [Mycobacterium intracellulare]|nr:hypothetical protein MINTMi27_14900 [Mycobacterium intracellulare]
MSIGVVLTIIFVVLKLLHDIDWSWWLVMLPVIIEAGLDIILVLAGGSLIMKVYKD